MAKSEKLTMFLLAGLAALSFSGCGKDNAGAQAADASKMVSAPPVEVIYPIKKSVELWDPYVSRIDSEYSVDIQARVGGYLDSVNFKDGDFVKKGDLLFVIDPRPYQALVDAAKAQVKDAEARIVLAESNAKRADELYETKAISKENLETRKSELLRAQAALLSAQAQLKQAELDLEFTHVRAPISGRVSERLVDAGNLIPSGQSPVLARIVSEGKVYAYFEVSERDMIKYMDDPKMLDFIAGKTKDGPEVKLNLTGENKIYKGFVKYVDNRIDRDSSTLRMRAELMNDDGKLVPGVFANLSVKAVPNKEYLMLPETIVYTDMLSRYVVVVGEDDVVRFAPVEIGALYDGNMRIIKSGISEKDRILYKGMFRALPGVKVSPKLVNIEEKK